MRNGGYDCNKMKSLTELKEYENIYQSNKSAFEARIPSEVLLSKKLSEEEEGVLLKPSGSPMKRIYLDAS